MVITEHKRVNPESVLSDEVGLTPNDIKKLNNELIDSTTPRLNKFIPFEPTIKQAAFMLLPQKEAFYGGAAGGGKSIAILMLALQYFDMPGYSGLVLRRKSKDLKQAGGLLTVAKEWLMPFVESGELHYSAKDQTFTNYNTGGKPSYLKFGHLAYEADKYSYQGGNYHFIGFDELTQISESNFTYLTSRLRRADKSHIPCRIRATANPGGIYHKWVKLRFVAKSSDKNKIFLPADLFDNPHVDKEDYIATLSELPRVERERLLSGDWDVEIEGSHVNVKALRFAKKPPKKLRLVRGYDAAGTEESEVNPDPDYTAGCLMGYYKGKFYIIDFRHFRENPANTMKNIKSTAEADGTLVKMIFEEEPGSAGKTLIEYYKNDLLKKFRVDSVKTAGQKNKLTRAKPFFKAIEDGLVYIVSGGYWIGDFIDELKSFGTELIHDDMVDAAVVAFNYLNENKVSEHAIVVPVGVGTSKWKEYS